MEKDSNLRRHRQQIYSLSPLATRESIHEPVPLYTIPAYVASYFFFFYTFCCLEMKKTINNPFFLQIARRIEKNLLNYTQWK